MPALIVCNHVSFMDALVIGGSVRRPVRFVMDHNIFKIPVMGFIFRTAHAIPIAPAREDPERAADQAFDRIDAELADGEIVCIFPEGKLTRDGEMNEFKKGVERILERRPVPVVPMALRGLWGSFFSRRDGKAAMSQLPRRFWSRIEVVATAPVHGDDASADGPAEDRRRPARRVAVMGTFLISLQMGRPHRQLSSPTSSAPSRASATPSCATPARAAVGARARAAPHAPRTSRAHASGAGRWHRGHPARPRSRRQAPHAQLDRRRAHADRASRAIPPTSAPPRACVRRLHAANVIHNDLAKETNWLVTPDGRPALVDFQLAMTLTASAAPSPARSATTTSVTCSSTSAAIYPSSSRRARSASSPRPRWSSRIWMASGKQVYLFVTRRIFRWRDREGAGDRDRLDGIRAWPVPAQDSSQIVRQSGTRSNVCP